MFQSTEKFKNKQEYFVLNKFIDNIFCENESVCFDLIDKFPHFFCLNTRAFFLKKEREIFSESSSPFEDDSIVSYIIESGFPNKHELISKFKVAELSENSTYQILDSIIDVNDLFLFKWFLNLESNIHTTFIKKRFFYSEDYFSDLTIYPQSWKMFKHKNFSFLSFLSENRDNKNVIKLINSFNAIKYDKLPSTLFNNLNTFIIDSCLKPEIQKNFLNNYGSLTNETLKDSFLSNDFLDENIVIYNFLDQFGVVMEKSFIDEIFKLPLTIKDKIDLGLVFNFMVDDILIQCKRHSNKSSYSKEFRLNFEEEIKRYIFDKKIPPHHKERKIKL